MVFLLNIIIAFISFLLFIILIPVFTGYFLSKRLQLAQNFYIWYLLGSFSLWAMSQLLLVPLVMAKASFYLAVFLVTVLYLVGGAAGILTCIAYGKITSPDPRVRFTCCWTRLSKDQRLSHTIALILTLFIIINVTLFQGQEFSDVHYLVSAVDMIKSGRMFMSNPASGSLLTHFSSSSLADVTSPWAFQYAFLGIVTFTKPVLAAHLMMPVQMIILCSCLYQLFAWEYDSDSLLLRNVFFIMMWTIQLLGCYSVHCSELALMTRGWHPSAPISTVGLPLIIYLYLRLRDLADRKLYFVLLAGVNLALCFMDITGMVLGLLLSLGFGIFYSIWKRSLPLMAGCLFSVVPNLFFLWLQSRVSLPSTQDTLSFKRLVNSFDLYAGDQLMIILAICLVITLCIFSRTRALSLVFPVLVSLALAAILALAGLLPSAMDEVNLYWLFPEALFITVGFLWIIRNSSGFKNHLFICCMFLLMLLISSNSFPAAANMHFLENPQKMDSQCKQIYDYILGQDKEASCFFCDEYVWAARQYSGDFILPYIYNKDGSLTFAHAHDQSFPQSMFIGFPASYYICSHAALADINYIVVKADRHLHFRILKNHDYYAVNRIDNTIIYAHSSPAETEQRNYISKQLNLGLDSFYKTLRKIDNEKMARFKILYEE